MDTSGWVLHSKERHVSHVFSEHNTGQFLSFFFVHSGEKYSMCQRKTDDEKLPSRFCNVTWQTAEGAIFSCSPANLLMHSWKGNTQCFSPKQMLINNSVLLLLSRFSLYIDIFWIQSFYIRDICLSYSRKSHNKWMAATVECLRANMQNTSPKKSQLNLHR